MKIGIIVGEQSGDRLAANLLKKLMYTHAKIKIFGIIGPELKKIGCEEIYSINELSIFGLIEPIIKIGKLIKIKKNILKLFNNKIDIFIGVDFSAFNLNIEHNLKKLGIFTIHIVSPSIWAWREYRIKNISKSVNIIMILFPFEKKIYINKKIPVKYIGHPFADLINSDANTYKIKKKLNIDPKLFIISLLPGSRINEIHHTMPIYMEIINKYVKKKTIFIIPVSNIKQYDIINNLYVKIFKNDNIMLLLNKFYESLKISNIIIVASGTASLEAFLHKKITIVVYKTNNLTFNILKKLIKIKYIALPNIIMGKYIVPEFIQGRFTSDCIYHELFKNNSSILLNKYRYMSEKTLNLLKKRAQIKTSNFISKFILC